MNTITLLKFRKQALKMQKAYKLYFSANLQLVIGKRFQKKKKKKKKKKKNPLCYLPLPLPKAEMKRKTEQNKNGRITDDCGII